MARGWSQAYRDENEGGDGGGEGQSVLGWVRGKGAEVIQSRRTGDRGQRTVRSEQRSAGPGRPCLRASGSCWPCIDPSSSDIKALTPLSNQKAMRRTMQVWEKQDLT